MKYYRRRCCWCCWRCTAQQCGSSYVRKHTHTMCHGWAKLIDSRRQQAAFCWSIRIPKYLKWMLNLRVAEISSETFHLINKYIGCISYCILWAAFMFTLILMESSNCSLELAANRQHINNVRWLSQLMRSEKYCDYSRVFIMTI